MMIDLAVKVTPYLSQFKAGAVTDFWRYLDPIGPANPKVIDVPEAHAIAAMGLRVGLVSEGWGDFAHGGISAGAGNRDADNALNIAPTLGAPYNATIAFAIDTDATQSQINGLVLPYFNSIVATFKGTKYGVMVYGSGAVCQAVIGAGLANYSWLSCSMGWLGSQQYLNSGQWTLRQHTPTKICGIDCDVDDPSPTAPINLTFIPFAT